MSTKPSDKRTSKRTPSSEIIRIFCSDPKGKYDVLAHIVDISATGIGLSTDSQLRNGQKIQFDKNHPNWSLPDQAVIVWSMPYKKQFRSGLKFLM